MNLYDLILRIPEFITETAAKNHKGQEKNPETGGPAVIGKFHLGL
jgi:hypothetical protein